MKKSLTILLSVVLVIGGCAPVVYGPGPGVGYVVAVGDRPYYTRGPYYIDHGRRYVWREGHWGRRHGHRIWVPGRYVIR